MAEFLKKLLMYLANGMAEKDVLDELVKYVYSKYKDKTLILFARLQDLEREENIKEIIKVRMGLEFSLNGYSAIARRVVGEETDSEATAKDVMELKFEEALEFLTPIMMAYYPSGEASGGSYNSKWIFDKFLTNLIKRQDTIKEGGINRKWAERQNYLEYYELVLSKIKTY